MKVQVNLNNLGPIVSQADQKKPAKDLKRRWMSESLFSEEDLNIFHAKGIEQVEVLRQLEILRKGTIPLKLARPARIKKGWGHPLTQDNYCGKRKGADFEI